MFNPALLHITPHPQLKDSLLILQTGHYHQLHVGVCRADAWLRISLLNQPLINNSNIQYWKLSVFFIRKGIWFHLPNC